jgi:hypothetical protein
MGDGRRVGFPLLHPIYIRNLPYQLDSDGFRKEIAPIGNPMSYQVAR